MNFFKPMAEPYIVTEKKLTADFKEQVLIVCDFRSLPGRPRSSRVFGTERKQMNRDIGQRILADLIAEIENKNGKLEKHQLHLYTARGQRDWVGQKLCQMASIHSGIATSTNSIDDLWKLFGDIIPIGRTPRLIHYVNKLGATHIEAAAFCHMVRAKSARQALRSARAISIVEAGIRALGDRTLEAAYADDCSMYRFHTTGT